MTACQQFVDNASLGVAPALRAVDCLAGETTAMAFGRLFSGQGSLGSALLIILTLYIAFFAVSLMLGRTRLSISALTPRMLTLGLVLTFATSWIAYQSFFWNLAVGAPDQIASVLTGSRGSATQIFADRIDMIFAAIGQAANAGQPPVAQAAAQGAQTAAQGAAAGTFTPANLMWISALLLLLGTVGVLVTARIALAILLAVGPVFLIFALFPGTRGLTAGWLRGVVLTAVTPLFVVLGGGIMIELLVPVIQVLAGPDGINGRAALALFLIASVHVALMVMVMKVAGTIVSGWQVFGLAGGKDRDDAPAAQAAPLVAPAMMQDTRMPFSRNAGMAAAAAAQTHTGAGGADGSQPSTVRDRRTVIAEAAGAVPALPPIQQRRARGIGSRFAAPAARNREALR